MRFGTSLPELIISATAALAHDNAISMGNVVGSNFANLFLIISLCAIIKPLHIKRQSRFIDHPFVLLCTLVLYFLSRDDNLSRNEGFILLGIALVYILYTILIAKFGKPVNDYKSENEEEIQKEKNLFDTFRLTKAIKNQKTKLELKFPIVYAILSIIIGVVLLKYGGDFTINSAKVIATIMGLSEKLIGVTIVAIGTSLPELITCLEATKKG